MAGILVRPPELRSKAAALRSSAERIKLAVENLDSLLSSLSEAVFEGNRASSLRSRYQSTRDTLLRTHDNVLAFATNLEQAAETFEKSDNPQVLGATTGGDYSNQSWKDILGSEYALRQQRNSLLDERQAAANALVALQGRPGEIDARLSDLAARKAQLEAALKDWKNGIIPNLPLGLGFDDGLIDAPWRTRADIIEDELARVNAEMDTLNNERNAVQEQIGNHEAIVANLDHQIQQNDADQHAVDERIRQLQGQYDGHNPAAGTTITNAARPVNPPLASDASTRDPRLYSEILDQFGVEGNPRYTPRNGNTYCNIYVWDATSAMGAEIPHWVDASGNPTSVAAPGSHELSANGLANWMDNNGSQNGWRAVSAEEAQSWANSGKPAVVTNNNPGGIGHVAMVRPGEYDAAKGPMIAQAGGRNLNSARVGDTFGSRSVVYWVHD